MKSIRCGFVGMVAVMFLGVCAPAGAVGFMVNPMTINVSPQPDTRLEQTLTLLNTQKDGEQSVDIKLLELSQGPEGGWVAVDVGESAGLFTSARIPAIPWGACRKESTGAALTGQKAQTAATQMAKNNTIRIGRRSLTKDRDG